MSRGEDIPQDVLKAAREASEEFARMNPALARMGKVMEYQLARAIMAERARCADVAILHGSRCELRGAVDAPLSKTRLEKLERVLHTCEDIATAIRAGGV